MERTRSGLRNENEDRQPKPHINERAPKDVLVAKPVKMTRFQEMIRVM